MPIQAGLEQSSTFAASTWPAPDALGRALQENRRLPGAVLRLRFGDEVAGVAVPDLWSACCELLLAVQLVREERLDHFVIDGEQIFELSYAGEMLTCRFSREHVFEVLRGDFASGLERVVREIFAATSCPRLMEIGANWSASAIRALPYSYRFSDSLPA